MIFLLIFILEERLPCQTQSVWGWWRRKRRRRFFFLVFSPQVVSFISFVVCLDLKGGDRLQALFSPGWSHVSQPEYREWLKLEKPPFLFIIFYATTKKRRNRIVFWREIHYRWEKNYYPPSGAPTFSNGKKELWRNDYQYTTLLSSSLRSFGVGTQISA